MGGLIGFGVAKYASHRVDSLVSGGAHPFARDATPVRQMAHEGITGDGGRICRRLGQNVWADPEIRPSGDPSSDGRFRSVFGGGVNRRVMA
jgi:hypothetical protein